MVAIDPDRLGVLAGLVSRVDGEKLQFLSFRERKNGEPFNLIPVTVLADGHQRHFEPVSFEASPETCLHAGDLAAAGEEEISNLKSQISKGEAVVGELARENAENAALRADRTALEQRLLGTGALLGEYQARFGELPTVPTALGIIAAANDPNQPELIPAAGAPAVTVPAAGPSVAVVPEQPIQPS